MRDPAFFDYVHPYESLYVEAVKTTEFMCRKFFVNYHEEMQLLNFCRVVRKNFKTNLFQLATIKGISEFD